MSDWLMSLIDYKVHGPLGVAVVAIIYLGRKHFISDKKEFGKADDRIRALEVDRVKRADLERLDSKLDNIAAQNTETLRMLAERR